MEQPTRAVRVLPYSPDAPRVFAELEKRIREVAPVPVHVEHVGSTAVPGLGGKGTIDCLVLTDTPEQAAEACRSLRACGFSHNANDRHAADRWFASGPLATDGHGVPHVHVHVTYEGSRCAWEMLAFRDHLRRHPEDADRYSRLKHEWSCQAGSSAARYTELKSGFVSEILERAEGRGRAELRR